MIAVKVSRDNFIYDVHSLVKAFYGSEEVRVFVQGEKELYSEGAPEIHIIYNDDCIEMFLYTVLEDGLELIDKDLESANYSERIEYKNALKQIIYRLLSKETGKELPWGTLTGIRPTKIAVSLIENGKSDEEVLKYYKDIYLASDRKANLAIDIAHRELDILSKINYEKGYSLYIGIPFCPTTCLYCSFTSFPRALYEKLIGEYINCLKKEIDYVAQNFDDKVLDSVYIGGGTPTTLLANELDDLISYLKSKIDMSHIKEFTVEAGRADSITKDKLEVLYKQGVTRISVNPQTFKQETLDIIGRRHTVWQVLEAYKLAREIGFDNINMDLIVGLPGEDYSDVSKTLDIVKELKPESVTVHSLAIKRASRLNQWITEHGIECITNSDEIMDMTQNIAEEMGLKPYYLYRQKNMSGNMENVGYATPGKEGIYNILIMEEVQTIVACGAGTVTKRVYGDGRIERCDNVKDIKLYIEKIDEMIDRKRELFK